MKSDVCLYIIGEINNELFAEFLPEFLAANAAGSDVTIFLSSPGGDENVGYAIYDLIRLSATNTRIVAMGSVESIAALIFQAATERIIAPHARFMIHNGEWDLDTSKVKSDDLVTMGRDAATLNRIYQSILAERSGRPIAEIQDLCREEAAFIGEAAITAGFADMLLGRMDDHE